MVAVASLGITSTSYLSIRFPALISGSKMEVYGKLNCSSTRRVQPSSMLPPPKRWYMAMRWRFISCAPAAGVPRSGVKSTPVCLATASSTASEPAGIEEIAGAQSGGRLVHTAQRHALVEQQIHGAEAVVQAAVDRVAVRAARYLSGRLDRLRRPSPSPPRPARPPGPRARPCIRTSCRWPCRTGGSASHRGSRVHSLSG